MTPQPKTRPRLTPRHAHAALALAIPAIALAACTTAHTTNDARWYGSTAVTQPPPHATSHHTPAPILPGTMASASPRFWDARRDAQLGNNTPGPTTAATEWPTQPRPNEQIFRFRTLQRN